MKSVFKSAEFFLILVAGCSISMPIPGDVQADKAIINSEVPMTFDFDFLDGEWTILHHRLKERMVGSDEWDTFETRYEAWQLLGGAASVDKLFGLVDGTTFEGVSVRTYDSESDEWFIYWMDDRNTNLREQARGRFEDGVGTFYGIESYRGVSYKMRFLWKDISERTARWEQAYQHVKSGDWETNWIMEFRKNSG